MTNTSKKHFLCRQVDFEDVELHINPQDYYWAVILKSGVVICLCDTEIKAKLIVKILNERKDSYENI